MTSETPSAPTPGGGLIHEALMYRNEAELQGAVREFVQAAAAAREPILIAMPGSHLDWVRDELAESAAGAQLEDMREMGRNPNRLLPMIEDWVARHDGPTRVVSESIWPERSYAERVECLRHEALLNHALADSGATIMCPYDAEHLDAATLAGAAMTHPTVVEAGRRRASSDFGDPVALQHGDPWPQEPRPGVVSEHRLDGSLQRLREAVEADPIVGSLSSQRRADLVFAVNEAATNAVRYGDSVCTTRLWRDGLSVVSEVSTETSLDDPFAGRRRPEPGATGGRGLWLINQICDLVELRSDPAETTLRMHVHD